MSKCPQILATYETGDDKGSLRSNAGGQSSDFFSFLSLLSVYSLLTYLFTVMTFMLKEAIYPVHDSNNQ